MVKVDKQAWKDLIAANMEKATEEKNRKLDSSSIAELKQLAKATGDPDFLYEVAQRYLKGEKGAKKNTLEYIWFLKKAALMGHKTAISQYISQAANYDELDEDIVSVYEKGCETGMEFSDDTVHEMNVRSMCFSIPASWSLISPAFIPKPDVIKGPETVQKKRTIFSSVISFFSNMTKKEAEEKPITCLGISFPPGSIIYDKEQNGPTQFTHMDTIPYSRDYKLWIPDTDFVYRLCQEIRNDTSEANEWDPITDKRHHKILGYTKQVMRHWDDMGTGDKYTSDSIVLNINKPVIVHEEKFGCFKD